MVSQSNRIGFSLLFASLVIAAGAGLLTAQSGFDFNRYSQIYLDLHSQANTRYVEAQFHRVRGGMHSLGMIEESVREAPARDISSKRLALSIALTKNGTGFEDRFIERVRQNATEEELNAFRNSFLSSLFESAPSALQRQETIQMHMDVLQTQLQHVGRLLNEGHALEQEASQERLQADRAEVRSILGWKSLLILMLAAVLCLALMHYHRPWLVYLSGALLLYGGVLLIRGLLL